MESAHFIRQIEDILQLEKNSIHGDADIETIHGWGSLALLSIIAIADCEYNVSLVPDDIKLSRTLNDIYKVIVNKK